MVTILKEKTILYPTKYQVVQNNLWEEIKIT